MVDGVKRRASGGRAPGGSGKRVYDSPRRREQARQTRQAVVDAAIALFAADGYASTTLQAVADRADVSVQTVYAVFGNKRALLADALDVAIAGDHLPVPVNAREWMQRVWDAPGAAERLRSYAAAVRRIMAGAGDMLHAVAAAASADPTLVGLAAETERRRRTGADSVVRSIEQLGELKPRLDASGATDILSLLNSPYVFRHLVRQAGWSEERYEAWLADAMVAQLLAEAPAPGGGGAGTGP